MQKQCTKCNDVKDVGYFYKVKDRHGEYRYLSCWCIECTALYSHKNYLKTKQNKRAKERENYSKNRSNIIKSKRRWINNNQDKYNSIKLKNRYGITIEEYNKILDCQGGVCAICKNNETVVDKKTGKIKKLSVDHDHFTGKVRGLLCNYCNHALGQFRDSVNLLKTAILYLENEGILE
jgi:hypothetical protein